MDPCLARAMIECADQVVQSERRVGQAQVVGGNAWPAFESPAEVVAPPAHGAAREGHDRLARLFPAHAGRQRAPALDRDLVVAARMELERLGAEERPSPRVVVQARVQQEGMAQARQRREQVERIEAFDRPHQRKR